MEPLNFKISSPQLSQGLRPSANVPRDSAYLVECKGGVGHQGSLQTLALLPRIPVPFDVGGFPYPQLFVFTNFIILCTQTGIFEWDGLTVTTKILGLPAGSPWTAVEFYDYLYLSNGKVAVTRSPSDGVFRVDSSLLAAEALLDAHGQVMAGGINDVVNPPTGGGGFGHGPFGHGQFGAG